GTPSSGERLADGGWRAREAAWRLWGNLVQQRSGEQSISSAPRAGAGYSSEKRPAGLRPHGEASRPVSGRSNPIRGVPRHCSDPLPRRRRNPRGWLGNRRCGAMSGNPPTVLFGQSDPEANLALREKLTRQGVRNPSAHSSNELLDIARQILPDV